MIREEGIHIEMENVMNEKKVTEFKVTGITCLDCAQKFEQAVKDLPGVMEASLNTMTGKLIVEGKADLAAIRQLGLEENYTVEPFEQNGAVKVTLFQVEGITCLDCAQSLRRPSGGCRAL